MTSEIKISVTQLVFLTSVLFCFTQGQTTTSGSSEIIIKNWTEFIEWWSYTQAFQESTSWLELPNSDNKTWHLNEIGSTEPVNFKFTFNILDKVCEYTSIRIEIKYFSFLTSANLRPVRPVIGFEDIYRIEISKNPLLWDNLYEEIDDVNKQIIIDGIVLPGGYFVFDEIKIVHNGKIGDECILTTTTIPSTTTMKTTVETVTPEREPSTLLPTSSTFPSSTNVTIGTTSTLPSTTEILIIEPTDGPTDTTTSEPTVEPTTRGPTITTEPTTIEPIITTERTTTEPTTSEPTLTTGPTTSEPTITTESTTEPTTSEPTITTEPNISDPTTESTTSEPTISTGPTTSEPTITTESTTEPTTSEPTITTEPNTSDPTTESTTEPTTSEPNISEPNTSEPTTESTTTTSMTVVPTTNAASSIATSTTISPSTTTSMTVVPTTNAASSIATSTTISPSTTSSSTLTSTTITPSTTSSSTLTSTTISPSTTALTSIASITTQFPTTPSISTIGTSSTSSSTSIDTASPSTLITSSTSTSTARYSTTTTKTPPLSIANGTKDGLSTIDIILYIVLPSLAVLTVISLGFAFAYFGKSCCNNTGSGANRNIGSRSPQVVNDSNSGQISQSFHPQSQPNSMINSGNATGRNLEPLTTQGSNLGPNYVAVNMSNLDIPRARVEPGSSSPSFQRSPTSNVGSMNESQRTISGYDGNYDGSDYLPRMRRRVDL